MSRLLTDHERAGTMPVDGLGKTSRCGPFGDLEGPIDTDDIEHEP
jgi:hypothetical protein